MITLPEFLLARIDEDEAVARAACEASEGSGQWWVDGPALRTGKFWIYDTGEKFTRREVAQHIARHNPARVLADCAANRAIIEFHEQWPVLVETPPTFDQVEPTELGRLAHRASAQIAWLTQQEYRQRFGDEPPTTPMLRALAAIYVDHGDYREEWAV